jgi:hypothetical protein
MRNLALLAILVALATSGCQVWTGGSAPARPDEGGNAATRRTSAIYAAVIHRLVTKDHTVYDEATPFERVFVVTTAGALYIRSESLPRPFSPAVEHEILAALRDLPSVRLVAHPDTAIVDEKSCGGVRVKRGAALITLGPIERSRGRAVTVRSGLIVGCLGKNGQWLTYVLKPKDGSWRVVSTKGLAIS